MRRAVWGVLALIVLTVAISGALAQDAPTTIDVALQDLSQRTGTPVFLESLSRWAWQGDVYTDSSLGCPQEGQSYDPGTYIANQYLLTYLGTTYDYRVTADGATVVYCGVWNPGAAGAATPAEPVAPAATEPPAESTPAPEAEPVTVDTAGDLPRGACEGGLIPELVVGETAQVIGEIMRLNLRTSPDLRAAIVTQIPAGTVVNVVDGPVCNPNTINWWQVEVDGVTGWAAETREVFRYLAPAEATPEIGS